MFQKVRIELKGVIENMSWFTGNDGVRYDLFGSGGGRALAELLEVSSSGRCPSCRPSAKAPTPVIRWSRSIRTARPAKYLPALPSRSMGKARRLRRYRPS